MNGLPKNPVHSTSSNALPSSLIPDGLQVLGLTSINGCPDKQLIIRARDANGPCLRMLPLADLVTGERRGLAILLADNGHFDMTERQRLRDVAKAMLTEAQSQSVTILVGPGYHEVEMDGKRYAAYVFDDQVLWFGPKPTQDVLAVSNRSPGARAGSHKRWNASIGRMLSGNHYLIVTHTHALAAAIRRAFGVPAHTLILVGPSSTGKTTVQESAQSQIGPVTGVRTMSGTPVGIRELLASNPDAPTYFQDTRQFATTDLVDLIFDAADGATRLISGQSKGPLAATLILSNERRLIDMPTTKTLAMDEGLYARSLDIECTAQFGAFHDLHGAPSAAEFANQLKRRCRECYGVVWPAWIRALSDHWDEVLDLHARWLPLVRTKLLDRIGTIAGERIAGRILDALTFSAWVGVMASHLRILPITKNEVVDAYALVLQQTLARQGNGATPLATRLIEALRSILEKNRARFADLAAFNECDGNAQILGYRKRTTKHGLLYLFDATTFTEMFVSRFGTVAYSILQEAGYLVTSTGRGHQFLVRIPGTDDRASFVAIKDTIRRV